MRQHNFNSQIKAIKRTLNACVIQKRLDKTVFYEQNIFRTTSEIREMVKRQIEFHLHTQPT